MPDILSRISLRVDGADQGAREINKIKKAFDDTGASAEKIKATVGGEEDAFKAATAKTGVSLETRGEEAARLRTEMIARKSKHDQEAQLNAERSDRMRQQAGLGGERRGAGGGAPERRPPPPEERRPTPGEQLQAYGGRAVRAAQGVGNFMQQLSGGNVLGAIGGGLGQVGGALSGILGGAGAIVGIPMQLAGVYFQTMGALAQKENERLQFAIGSGTAQRMGASYMGLRNWRLQMGREGVPQGISDAMIQAYSQAGGTWQGNAPTLSRAARITSAYGVSGALMGQTMGLMNQAGIGPLNPALLTGMRRAEATVGLPNVSRVIESMADALETAMERGMQKGSSAFSDTMEETASRIAAYSQYGNLTAAGATSLERMVRQATYTPAQLQDAEDFRRFMFFHQPGQTFAETRLQMNAPGGMHQYLSAQANIFGGAQTQGFQDFLMNMFPQASMEQILALQRGEGQVPAIGQQQGLAMAPLRTTTTGAGLMAGLQAEPLAGLELSAAASSAQWMGRMAALVGTIQSLAPDIGSIATELRNRNQRRGPVQSDASFRMIE